MKTIKKMFIACALSSAVFAFSANQANAIVLTDVPSDFWAKDAIVSTVENGYIQPKGDKFLPSQAISRADFANAVYGIINRSPLPGSHSFKDVKTSDTILTLHQLQIVFGYPDGNFKPGQNMKRSEASSVIANILRSDFWDDTVLDKYKDKEDIPAWASSSYINNIVNDIYVDYPNSDVLRPNADLTRAEAAVLVSKLKTALEAYKVAYSEQSGANGGLGVEDKVVPVFVGEQTLNEYKHPFKNTVDIYDCKKVITAGNIVPVQATQKMNSKTIKEGEILTYISPKDVYSTEGTKLYDAGTKFVAYVERTENSYWRKKQNKAYIVFNKAVLNDGTEFPIAGVLYSMYNGDLVSEKNKNSKKVEKDATKQYKKRDAALKMTNKLVPVLKYKENGKTGLYMLVTGDMIIPESSSL